MVGLLLITHGNIGDSLLKTAKDIVRDCDAPVETLSVSNFPNLETLIYTAQERIQALDQGQGVLVLTDLFGATPHNIASRLGHLNISIVSGLNLSMLLRTLNYANQCHLNALADKAQQGGVKGIVCRHKLITQQHEQVQPHYAH